MSGVVATELMAKVEAMRDSGAFTPDEAKVMMASLRIAQQVAGRGPFICGMGGAEDVNNMPQYFFICPEYGCDGSYRYTRSSDYEAPGW